MDARSSSPFRYTYGHRPIIHQRPDLRRGTLGQQMPALSREEALRMRGAHAIGEVPGDVGPGAAA